MKRLRRNGQTGTMEIPFRLRFTGNERRNIVTVDWVADMIVHILLRPTYHGKTYHLTPKRASSSREILGAMMEYFDYQGVEFVGNQTVDRDDQTEIERFFYDFVSTFEAYWEDEPIFDRTNTDSLPDAPPTPPIDAACLKRLIDFAVKNCFK
jgi:nucleoside-diphosphate-sugar epimerase